MKYLILLAMLSSCTPKPVPHVLGKYELSTDKETAKKQCKQFFNKFHGKYRKVKYYGKVTKESTLHFFKQPDCAMACITSTFYWECDFATNDDDRGYLDFVSDKFYE